MKFFHLYINSFRGLSKEIWFLALVTLINRAGTMVVPFLSLYLTTGLHFSLEQVGWIMSAFGSGSVLGAFLGGKLCKNIGFYKVMVGSLILSGIMFISLQFINTFWMFCGGIFVLMLVADTFRPASYVAINAYSNPDNRTRSVTLIRLAINLGFSFGPAIGGLIIFYLNYGGLFWIDGITCITAAFLFLKLLKNKHLKEDENENTKKVDRSPYTDKIYLLGMFATFLIAFAFLQYFSTIPLYYHEVHHLTEKHIGWLMAMNGLLIFLIEMPLMKFVESKDLNKNYLLFFSTLLFALSFVVLNLFSWVGILVIGMLLMTIAEMLNFPFLNAFALKHAEKGNAGEYLALFTMAFAVAQILGHNSGIQLIEKLGYESTWYIMATILVLSSGIFLFLNKNDGEGKG
jgi:predicted MFS family arabinose efflux permease